ncbi:MAG: phage tail tape measure protein, partial [Clostridium sp.]|uniref:phage tail tape measure protein n=1 Tax=Clostridium sp. TaxID=1506 RepID=UPI002FC75927
MSVNVGQAVGYLTLDKNPFSAGLKSAGQDLNNFMDTTKSSESRINGLANSMTAFGGMLTKGVSIPLAGVGALSVVTAANFEEGMSKVQAISGATGHDMELLSAKAKEMGSTTKFSATESAEALSYMGMAGWKTDQMLSGLPGIMNLAAASGEDLATTSDIVTDAMTAFGLSAEESGRFADVLASASSNANTNVGMMGETFKYVAPVAGAMKYSIEDTAIAIGLMANSGIKASQAGTSLRQIMMGLQGGVELTTKSTNAWRIEVENSDGTMRDFRSVLVDLREGFADMTDAQKAQNAESIAGKVGMSGLLAIVNASQTDFDKLSGAIDNSAGSAEKMAEIMGDNLKGKFTIFKSSLEGAGIAIGETLLPMLTAGVEKI